MVALGYITQAEADQTVAAGAPPIVGERTPEGCVNAQLPQLNAGFFCDYLQRWWAEQEAFGADRYERLNTLHASGYRIVTSFDIQAQTAAVDNIRRVMDRKRDPHEAMMLAAVEPGTGLVRALAVNRVFSNDQSRNEPNTNPGKKGLKGNYPNTTVPLLTGGGEVQGYQAGSVFKIFTVVAALERGIPLDHTIDTVSPYGSKYPVFDDSPARCPDGPYYCPENYNHRSMGRRDMWTGLGSSINTYFVPLQERIGTEYVVDAAQRLGVQFHTFTLGVTAHTPLEMANAFATLAADGLRCEPIPVVEIRDRNGARLEGTGPRCTPVVDPDVARGAVDAARCPVGDRSHFDRCQGSTAGDTRRIVGSRSSGRPGPPTTSDPRRWSCRPGSWPWRASTPIQTGRRPGSGSSMPGA